ncbi:hypothetical protein NIE79_003649 [Micromonospora sp. NIE79]|uniref:Uncharacterized protein n=1 Tax=Micromonospora trifolii TaxID=2911208 RepID=A0ABS9N5H0_9ACTN|nr:hypothetical protein [Micromonospora trifolii]MCG5445204.1 hypothetical protein [Micromonospora trifolii]
MSANAVDDLRAAWLATISAADRAGAQLHGAGPPGRRLPWQDAVTECWRALSLVYAGLAADRESPGGSVGNLLAGLRAAQVDADRAAALAARVRRRLSASEDRLRRTREVADIVAARHLAAAITRLDLVVARLAVGGRRIERSVAALTEEPAALTDRSLAGSTEEPAPPPVPPRPTSHAEHDSETKHDSKTEHDSKTKHDSETKHENGRASDADSAEVIARGCQAASALVTRRQRLTRPRAHRRALTMIRGRRW